MRGLGAISARSCDHLRVKRGANVSDDDMVEVEVADLVVVWIVARFSPTVQIFVDCKLVDTGQDVSKFTVENGSVVRLGSEVSKLSFDYNTLNLRTSDSTFL